MSTIELNDGDPSLCASVEEMALPLPPQLEAEDEMSWTERVENIQHKFKEILPQLPPTIKIDDLTEVLNYLLSWEENLWDADDTDDHVFISYDTDKITNTIRGVMPHCEIKLSPVLIFVYSNSGEKMIYLVFRISASKVVEDQFVIFIDYSNQKYKDWADFLQNNQLPEGKFCYPHDGKYELPLQVHVREKFKKQNKIDIIMYVLGAVSTTLVLIKFFGFFPYCAPLTFVSLTIDIIVACYFFYRNVKELDVRHTNGQDITLENEHARGYWLSIVVYILNIFSSAAILSTVAVTAVGLRVSLWGERLVEGLRVTKLVVRGIELANKLISKMGLFLKKVIFRCKRFISIACKGVDRLLEMKKKN